MAMMCDACGEKFGREDGHASLHVNPPRPDFKLITRLTRAGKTFEHREMMTLDLCRACTAKALTTLGQSTEICELPELSEPVDDEGVPDRPPIGALTSDELRELGIEP